MNPPNKKLLRFKKIIFEQQVVINESSSKEEQSIKKVQQAEANAKHSEAKAQQADAKAQQADAKAQQAEAKAQQAEAKAQQAATKADELASQLSGVYSSKSCRVTGPVRWSLHQLRLLLDLGFKHRGKKAAVKKVLRKFAPWLVARPKLKSLAIQFAYKLGMAERLKPFVRSLLANRQQAIKPHYVQAVKADLTALTSRSRHIYHGLKRAIDAKQKGGA